MIGKIKTALIRWTIARWIIVLTIGIASCFVCIGCAESNSKDTSKNVAEDTSVATYADIANMDLTYSNRDKDASYNEADATKIYLEETTARVDGQGVSVQDSYVTIESEGTYLISGQLDNGQIAVDVADTEKVHLVLAGASVHNDTGSALYIKQTDKCFITLASDTENTLSDGANYSFAEGEDEPDATLFSKDDLTINGTGALTVTSAYADAIASKDDLVVTGGTFTISAVDDGLRGKDSLKILDGSFEIEAGQDCLKSSRDDDPARGFVCINGGTFELNAGDDAIHGETYLYVTAGNIAIASCNEGLEAMVVQIDGGDIAANAQDDALNAAAPSASSTSEASSAANNEMTKNLPEKDFSDAPQDMPEGNPRELPEGAPQDMPEGTPVNKPEHLGKPDVSNNSDGLNKPDASNKPENFDKGTDMFGEERSDPRNGMPQEPQMSEGEEVRQEGRHFGGMEAGNENCKIIINGGNITLEAKGDAIDSNGSLEINGGTLYVTGPTSNGDSALDYALDAACNGGTIVIVGSAGMAQDFSSSAQPSAFVKVNGMADQKIIVADQAGTELISYTPSTPFETVIVSSPEFKAECEYSLIVGDSTTAFTATTK